MSLATHSVAQIPELLNRMDLFFDETDHELDFDEFKEFMRDFLPSASDDQFLKMFHNIDTDDSSTISKEELLNSNFFTEFLRTTDRLFSLQHDALGQDSQEVVQQLQNYMRDVGRPAEARAERLQQQVSSLKEENQHLKKENQAFQEEVIALQEAEKEYEKKIELLKSQEEVQEIEIHDKLEELAEETDQELVFLETELQAERQRASTLVEQVREMNESNIKKESSVRQLKLQIKQLELQVERLTDKNERVDERLIRMTDKYEAEKERGDLLMNDMLNLQREIDEQQDYIDERDRYSVRGSSRNQTQTQFPFDFGTLRIDSQAFYLDGMGDEGGQFGGGGGVGDDDGSTLFFEMQRDESLSASTYRHPVQVFASDGIELTPEPSTVSSPTKPRSSVFSRLKNVVNKAKKLQHKKNKTVVDFQLGKQLTTTGDETELQAPKMEKRRSRSVAAVEDFKNEEESISETIDGPDLKLASPSNKSPFQEIVPTFSTGSIVQHQSGLEDLAIFREAISDEMKALEDRLMAALTLQKQSDAEILVQKLASTMNSQNQTESALFAGMDEVPQNVSQVKSDLSGLRDDVLLLVEEVNSMKRPDEFSASSSNLETMKQELEEMRRAFEQQQHSMNKLLTETSAARESKPMETVLGESFGQLRTELATLIQDIPRASSDERNTSGDGEPQWMPQMLDEISSLRKDISADSKKNVGEILQAIRHRSNHAENTESCFSWFGGGSRRGEYEPL